jgi:hypothetical protein
MAMVMMMPGGSGGGGQSGGADYSGCTEGESDLAEHGGSPVSGVWCYGGCGHHILHMGRPRPGKGSKLLFSRIGEKDRAPFFHANSG